MNVLAIIYMDGRNIAESVYLVDTNNLKDSSTRNLFETGTGIGGPDAFLMYDEVQNHREALRVKSFSVKNTVMIWCET